MFSASTASPRATHAVAGLAKAELLGWEHGRLMLGWVDPENRATHVAEPLHCRALVLEQDGQWAVYASVELCFVGRVLKQRVLERVQHFIPSLEESTLLLAATHNHSGPGGFSSPLLYNFSAGGFRAELVEALADDIANAVMAAFQARRPATLTHHRASVQASPPVAYNRRLTAHNRNRDVSPFPTRDRHLAIDPEMDVLWLEDLQSRPLGVVSWWGLHGTTIHGDNQGIRPDHKGRASAILERELGVDGFIAIFAQAAAGDVSPNAHWSPSRGREIGPLGDDLADRERVARAQVETVLRARQTPGQPLIGPIHGQLRRIAPGGEPISPEWTDGRGHCGLEEASLGMAIVRGTQEGVGLKLPQLPWTAWSKVSALTKPLRRTMPMPWRDRLRAAAPGLRLPVTAFGHPALRTAEQAVVSVLHHTKAAAGPDIEGVCALVRAEREVAPPALTVQLLSLAGLRVAAVPVEATTHAGFRMLAAATALGEGPTVLQTYANDYAGYATTAEEYELQAYEGASTLFGRWTTAAICQALADMHTAPLGARPARDRADAIAVV